MRISLLSDPSIPVPPTNYGGIERVVDALVQYLLVQGHEVQLLAHPESTNRASAFCPWPIAQTKGLVDHAANTQAAGRALRQFAPDVVHCFARGAYALEPMLRRWPVLVSYQRPPTPRTVRLMRWLSGGRVAFSACSAYIERLGTLGGGNWRTIYNFVPLERFQFRAEVAADAPLVFLSRLERIKGVHNAIAVARETGRRLIIAGNRVDSIDGRHYFEQEIAPHVDGRLIDYVGPVDDAQKSALLGSAAAMLVPIEWDEPFGIVFAEALACGTPVISSARGALPEIIIPGRHGFLGDSLHSWVAAVAKLPTIRREDCRQRAEGLFSADVVGQAYLACYRDLLAHG